MNQMINADQLRNLIVRIEVQEAEIRCAQSARNDLYIEAKATGLDPKVIKTLVRERKQDQRELDLFNDAVALYRKALAG